MYVCKYEYRYVHINMYHAHTHTHTLTHTHTHTHTIPARRSSRLPPSIRGVTRQTASPARSPSAANPSTGSRCSCRQAPSTCSSCRHSSALPLLYHCFTTALLLLYWHKNKYKIPTPRAYLEKLALALHRGRIQPLDSHRRTIPQALQVICTKHTAPKKSVKKY